MQFLQQQPYGGFPGQCQQCVLTPGYPQAQQQQFSPYGGLNPQQFFNNPYQQQQQQQFYYPQQQQQFFYPQQQQQQFPYLPQAQAAFYPQQQAFYPQQQQYPSYPQQQPWGNWPQGAFGQNVNGFQQFWPQQQRVFEDPSSSSPSPRHEKVKPKKAFERLYH